jgi:hypothetical protein
MTGINTLSLFKKALYYPDYTHCVKTWRVSSRLSNSVDYYHLKSRKQLGLIVDFVLGLIKLMDYCRKPTYYRILLIPVIQSLARINSGRWL